METLGVMAKQKIDGSKNPGRPKLLTKEKDMEREMSQKC